MVAVWTQQYIRDPAFFGPGNGISGQIFNSDGAVVSARFDISNKTMAVNQVSPTLTVLSNGNFAVAWEVSTGPTSNIASQVFSNAGVRVGQITRVTTDDVSTSIGNANPSIIAKPDGGSAVVWTRVGTGSTNINLQKFDSSGNMVGARIAVDASTTAAESYPIIAVQPDGNLCVAWQRNIGTSSIGTAVMSIRMKVFASNTIANDIGIAGQTLTGTSRSDTLIDLDGTSTMFGRGGADKFVIAKAANAGSNIKDFDPSQQKVDLAAHRDVRDISDLSITSGSAIVHLPGNQTVHVDNTAGNLTPADLTAANFVFAPPNHAPVANCSSITTVVQSGTQIALNTAQCVTDPDSDTLTWGNTQASPELDYSWMEQDPFTGKITGQVPEGIYTGNISATDPYGASASLPFSIKGIAAPSAGPTTNPSGAPSAAPHAMPSAASTAEPSAASLPAPSVEPSVAPSGAPHAVPSPASSIRPSVAPSPAPSASAIGNIDNNSAAVTSQSWFFGALGGAIGTGVLAAVICVCRKEIKRWFSANDNTEPVQSVTLEMIASSSSLNIQPGQTSPEAIKAQTAQRKR